MTLILIMILRSIIIISPIVILTILMVRKKFKFFNIIIVLIMLINSFFMLFYNINQKNIFEMNLLDINKVTDYFVDIEFKETKHNKQNIYITDESNDFNQIANFTDISYTKYPVSDNNGIVLNEIVSDSTVLKQVPKLSHNISGINYYTSDLKGNMNFWNIFYNSSVYNGCVIIQSSDEIYYIEYEVELNSSKSNIDSFFEQVFYRSKFDDTIDIMKLFEK